SAAALLAREDQEAASLVKAALEKDGVHLRLKSKLVSAKKTGDGKQLSLENGDQLVVDEILVGVGRAPNVEGLNLEGAGVEYDTKTGVKVNDHLQTSNPRIFAAGDVCSRLQFTHLADAMARIVIS